MARYMDTDDFLFEAAFEWDEATNRQNQIKHGVSFDEARLAFADPNRLIFADLKHGDIEERSFCVGWTGRGVMTVRFTHRDDRIRILGAGYWRKTRSIYEDEQRSIH
jgi:uncharacterized DUF497 family protein